MISKYYVFCKVIERGSFTKVAHELGYSQSAVSQIVKSLEQELGTTLVNRGKEGITLTKDGQQFLPYLQSIQIAEKDLQQKCREVQDLENSTVRIGSFTSISQNFLPSLMKKFKALYPKVHFELLQGEYTSINHWIQNDTVDFGFIYDAIASGLETQVLYQDVMLAVLPKDHPLAKQPEVTLAQLSEEPLILLDEGDFSVALQAFEQKNLSPNIEFKIYDDYSILAMVQQNLGISLMYSLVLEGFSEKVAIRPIKERPERRVALGWRKWETMSYASRKFAEFIMTNIAKEQSVGSGLKFLTNELEQKS